MRNSAVAQIDEVLCGAHRRLPTVRANRILIRMTDGSEQNHRKVRFDQSDKRFVFRIGVENDERINAFAPG
jgi:hypothetical protein